MSEETQIEEMAKIITKNSYLCKGDYIRTTGKHNRDHCKDCDLQKACLSYDSASELYNAGYRKQSEGEWEWFEEWSPSTTEHPRECDECGWRCGKCKTALADIVGGYWDDPDEKPNLNFCPDCGAKMKGGAE